LDVYVTPLEPDWVPFWKEKGGYAGSPAWFRKENLLPEEVLQPYDPSETLGVTSHYDLICRYNKEAGLPLPGPPERKRILFSKVPPNFCPHEGLFPFQRQGVWILSWCPNLLLADEQGLGKTIQAAVALSIWCRRLKNMRLWKGMLVFCPASLKGYWQEVLKEWGGLSSVVLYGKKPTNQVRRMGDIFILNYEIAAAWRNFIQGFPWTGFVLDEAQRLKNPDAKATKVILNPGQEYDLLIKWALTGTPMPNRPWDLYTLYRWLDPAGCPNRTWWKKRYCNLHLTRIRVRGGGFRIVQDFKGSSNEKELHARLTSKIFYRRTKVQVLPDLPPKLFQVVPLNLDATYGLSLFSQEILRASGLKKEPEWGSEKWKMILENARQSARSSSQDLDLQSLGLEKVDSVLPFVRDALETEGKIVLWCWHRSVVDRYMEGLADLFPVRFTGQDTPGQKAKAIKEFCEGKARVFVANIRSAGTGLNLQVASHAVFAEISWVPTDIVQAEDRIHRIGTKRPAYYTYFVVGGTVEEWVIRNLVEKQKGIEKVIEGETEK
jgi:SNF2 family DNA or RNA helicase